MEEVPGKTGNDTIIIDEPELGLHPLAITKLAGMIKSVASKGIQVIVATLSVELVAWVNFLNYSGLSSYVKLLHAYAQ